MAIEVRFIRINDSFFERIGIDFDFNIEDNIGDPTVANTVRNEGTHSSVTVGVVPSGIPGGLPALSADLDVPFRNESFALATPTFGTPSDVFNFGFAILSDIEAYFLIRRPRATGGLTSCRPPRSCSSMGNRRSSDDQSQTSVRDQRRADRRRLRRRATARDCSPLRRNLHDHPGGHFGRSPFCTLDRGAVFSQIGEVKNSPSRASDPPSRTVALASTNDDDSAEQLPAGFDDDRRHHRAVADSSPRSR